jgi:hypothetical protein
VADTLLPPASTERRAEDATTTMKMKVGTTVMPETESTSIHFTSPELQTATPRVASQQTSSASYLPAINESATTSPSLPTVTPSTYKRNQIKNTKAIDVDLNAFATKKGREKQLSAKAKK